MSTVNSEPTRNHKKFVEELNWISRERIKLNKDKKQLSIPRLTRAILRTPEWDSVKKKLLTWEIPKKDNDGGINSVFASVAGIVIFIIVALMFVLISGVYLFGFNTITNTVTTIPGTVNGTQNISTYFINTFGQIDLGFQQLRWISLMVIFGMVIGIFVSSYIVRAHPAFFSVYVLLGIAVVVFSIYISRTYESLYNSGTVVGTTLQSFTGSSYILLYLPVWVTVITFVGGIILFVNMGKDPDGGTII